VRKTEVINLRLFKHEKELFRQKTKQNNTTMSKELEKYILKYIGEK
jgi:hypothetical protein